MKLFSKIFGDNEREVKRYWPIVEQVNAHEEELEPLSEIVP